MRRMASVGGVSCVRTALYAFTLAVDHSFMSTFLLHVSSRGGGGGGAGAGAGLSDAAGLLAGGASDARRHDVNVAARTSARPRTQAVREHKPCGTIMTLHSAHTRTTGAEAVSATPRFARASRPKSLRTRSYHASSGRAPHSTQAWSFSDARHARKPAASGPTGCRSVVVPLSMISRIFPATMAGEVGVSSDASNMWPKRRTWG